MTSVRIRRTAAIGAATLALLALAGCGTSKAGAASVVGATTVSDSDVAHMVDDLRTAIGEAATASFDEKSVTRSTVNRLTRHLLLAEAAARQGITVTQADVDKLINGTIASNFAGDTAAFEQAIASSKLVPPNEIESFARDALITVALNDKLAPGGTAIDIQLKVSAYLGPLSKELGVEISPRFGTWSYAAATISDLPNDLSFVPGGTSTLAPSPAPSAS